MMDELLLARIRAELSKVKVPSSYDRVYKDECMFSFASPESEGGIFVSLSTWQAFGSKYLTLDHERTGNKLYYNEKHFRVPLSSEDADKRAAVPTEMAIGGNHGFQVDQPNYKIEKHSALVVLPDRANIPLPCPELPELVLNAITGIQGNSGAEQQDETAHWEEDRKNSKYAESLEQVPADRVVSSDPADWVCEFTGVKDNLWLNLSTGKIGSGRPQWDGSGGNGAALRHFEETGKRYPLCVKLGTVTPKGADVFSYADDENDLVLDPLLKQHLAHWGIDMMTMEKTAKTMSELQIDMNIKFEYNAITEGGQELTPVFGPGLVGLTNGGNYCYMSSILQALWGIPAVASAYFAPAADIMRSAPTDVAQDFASQLAKVGCALMSGDTDKTLTEAEEQDTDATRHLQARVQANAVNPQRFKTLIGRNHADFGTAQQQDACQFFLHLVELLARSEQTLPSRAPSTRDTPPVSSLFTFTLTKRTQCMVSGAASYKDTTHLMLSLQLPLESAVNSHEVQEYKEREEKRRKLAETDADAYISAAGSGPAIVVDSEEPVIPVVPFESCLESFASEEVFPDYFSPAVGAKGQAVSTQRIGSFPPYLMVHLEKYYMDTQYRTFKKDVLAGMRHSIDLEHLRSTGPMPNECLQPEDPATPAAPVGPVPNPEIVSMLTAAGFSDNASKRAALAVSNSNPEAAMNWLLSHMEDADINDSLPGPTACASAVAADSPAVDPAQVSALSMLMEMGGFTERQVKGAMKACDSNAERAADWLFMRMGGDLDAEVAKVEALSGGTEAVQAAPVNSEMLDGHGKYELAAIVSHIGSNTACGHYVAHVKKGGQWYIFNDEKVASSERLPIEHGYMYLYRRIDQPWA